MRFVRFKREPSVHVIRFFISEQRGETAIRQRLGIDVRHRLSHCFLCVVQLATGAGFGRRPRFPRRALVKIEFFNAMERVVHPIHIVLELVDVFLGDVFQAEVLVDAHGEVFAKNAIYFGHDSRVARNNGKLERPTHARQVARHC